MPKNDTSVEVKSPTLSQTVFQGQKSPKKRKKVQVLEQWVEVRIREGRTVTTLYPSNRSLVERGKEMWPAPELVYRRFNFPDGVPDEYSWVGITEDRKKFGGCGIQRMATDTWLALVETEDEETPRAGYQSSNVPKHVGPTGVGNLPRPKDRGECECSVCQRNQAILDADSPEV